MKFGSIVVVALILGLAGLGYAQQGQDKKKKPAKPSHAMVKKTDTPSTRKEDCAKMGKEECAKMKDHGSMECCKSDSAKTAPEK